MLPFPAKVRETESRSWRGFPSDDPGRIPAPESTRMLDLSKLFEDTTWLNGAIPQIIWKDGRAFDPVQMLIEVT